MKHLIKRVSAKDDLTLLFAIYFYVMLTAMEKTQLLLSCLFFYSLLRIIKRLSSILGVAYLIFLFYMIVLLVLLTCYANELFIMICQGN